MAEAGGGGDGVNAAGNVTIGASIQQTPGLLAGTREALLGTRGALRDLMQGFREFTASKFFLASGINSLLSGITQQANTATAALNGVTGAVGGLAAAAPSAQGQPQTQTQAAHAPARTGGPQWQQTAQQSVAAAAAATGPPPLATPGSQIVGGGGGGGGGASVTTGGNIPPAGMSFTNSVVGLNTEGDFAKNMMMFPLRFMREQIDTNRTTALLSASALARQSFATGQSTQNQMLTMARNPGSIQGNISDQLSLFGNSSQYGAMYGWGGQNAPRTAGYLESIREAQMITPGAPVAQMGSVIGGFAGNVPAQQQSQMLTGGAFGMVKPGGGQKSLSEWAESVLRWLEGQQAGADRGKPFDYGKLIAQYFPGSNIDAWFDANGVPQDMREYWWAYALRKAKTTGSTQGEFKINPEQNSVMWQRLRAVTSQAQGQFNLAGTMAGAYANKEVANRWFNDLMASFINQVIPSAVSTGKLGFAQFMPDTMEQLLMQVLERSGKFGSVAGMYLGYGGSISGGSGTPGISPPVGPGVGPGGTPVAPALPQPTTNPQTVAQAGSSPAALRTWLSSQYAAGELDEGEREEAMNWADQQAEGGGGGATSTAWRKLYNEIMGGDYGDTPDIGDQYTTTGGTGLAGMHPDMRRKLGNMMSANPKIRINSGLRDTAMQQRLKARGVGKVSGKPSAHTRGMAADLGPSSQYGWIVNNASKFGLSSGVRHGEPWHVGMGDLPLGEPPDDPADAATGGVNIEDLTSLLSGEPTTTSSNFDDWTSENNPVNILLGFMKLLGMGGGTENTVTGISNIVTPFFNLLRGVISGPRIDANQIRFQGEELYNDLYGRVGGLKLGGITLSAADATGRLTDKQLLAIGTAAQIAAAVAAAAGAGAAGGGVPLPGGATDPGSEAAGIAAATALFNAGFTSRENLETITAISWRESKWNPASINPNSADRGLMQINWKAHRETLRDMGINGDDPPELLNIQTNANVAHRIWENGGANYTSFQQLWGFSESSSYLGGKPGWDNHGDPLARTADSNAAAIVAAANLPTVGDIPESMSTSASAAPYTVPYEYSMPQAGRPTTGTITFNNTFAINGGNGAYGGIDLRRTVTLIADHLEDEMKTRALRSN